MTHVSIAVEDILFYVDPIFEDNERDRNFVFELVKNWRKNTDDSSEEIDSEEVFLESQKYLSMKHREIYSILEKNPNVLLVYSNPKVKLTTMINKISKNLIENKRTLILSPINSNLSQTFKVLNRFFQNRMSYLNSMPNEISKDSKILFSTVTYISDEPDILKTFDTIFLDEPYYFYGLKNSSKDVSKVIELLHSWLKDGKELYLLGMQYSNETIKFFEKLFSPQFVIKEAVKKKELGLIDSRNVKDKLKYIKNTIRENGFVIVITSSPSNSVNLVKNLGNELIDIFKNGEIVFYNEFLKLFQMKKIENLLKKNRIRVLISTSSITDLNIEYDNVNIIFYDAPKIPQEMLLPIHAIDGKRSLITHMTFGKEDIEKNLEFLDSIFPSKKKIMEVYEYAVKYQKEGWEKIKEALVKDKIIESDSYFKIYQNIFSELGLLNNGKIKNLNPSEIPKSKRYREGILEKVVVNSFSKKLSESSPRDLLKIITISGGR
jgi:single-stranded-DNA-specific exonuclease